VSFRFCGQAVTISPHRTTLTTQEAAEMLGVSRPTLVKLLEAKKIPFSQPGRHRRVRLADILAFQQRQAEARSSALTELANASDPDPENAAGFVKTR
jgi:excisionase family DNA binding protein